MQRNITTIFATNEIRASTKERAATKKIVELVNEGHFNYSTIAKIALTAWGIISAGLAFGSAQLYLKIGGEGTHLLPPSSFFKTQEFLGKWSAFLCNFSINWYFMIATVLDIRNAYLNYTARKKLGIPYTNKELCGIALKIGFGLIMAGTSGAVFSLIAREDSEQPVYIQLITFGANTLLNFIGSIFLQTKFIALAGGVVNYFRKTENSEAQYPQTDRVKSLIKTNLKVLKRKRSDDRSWEIEAGVNIDSTLNPLLKPTIEETTEETPLTQTTQANQSCQRITAVLKEAPYWTVWLVMQSSNLVSLSGWYLDTIEDVGDLFGIGGNSGGAWILGSMFFVTFTGLAIKLMHETIGEAIELGESLVEEAKHVKKNPGVMEHADFYRSTPINLVAILLTVSGYFLGYVSSNSSLGLNDEYGFGQARYVYPTCLASAVFNGFGFLGAFIVFAGLAKKYRFDSPRKRHAMDKNNQIFKVISDNPGIIDKMTESESESNLVF